MSKKNALVPEIDQKYVKFGHYELLKKTIDSGLFVPVFITSDTSNGKSTMVEQVCAELGRGCIRINFNENTDEDQLMGYKTLQNGNIEIVEAGVMRALREGHVLLLDEIDAGNPNSLMCLQPILEGKSYYFKLKNEIVTPHPNFTIVATANTTGKGSLDGRYVGTNVLNEAFLERFSYNLNQDYPPVEVEQSIAHYYLDFITDEEERTEFAESLSKWSQAIKKHRENTQENTEVITTRRLIHICKIFSITEDITEAIKLALNRFDETHKSAFLMLWQATQDTAQKKKELLKKQNNKESDCVLPDLSTDDDKPIGITHKELEELNELYKETRDPKVIENYFRTHLSEEAFKTNFKFDDK